MRFLACATILCCHLLKVPNKTLLGCIWLKSSLISGLFPKSPCQRVSSFVLRPKKKKLFQFCPTFAPVPRSQIFQIFIAVGVGTFFPSPAVFLSRKIYCCMWHFTFLFVRGWNFPRLFFPLRWCFSCTPRRKNKLTSPAGSRFPFCFPLIWL